MLPHLSHLGIGFSPPPEHYNNGRMLAEGISGITPESRGQTGDRLMDGAGISTPFQKHPPGGQHQICNLRKRRLHRFSTS